LTVWQSNMTIDGSGSRPALARASRRSSVSAFSQTPLARHRRNCCPDGTPRAEVAGKVAPLAARAGLVEDGVDHATSGDASRCASPAGRVEEVTNQAPLGVAQVSWVGHEFDGARRPPRGTRGTAFRTQGLSLHPGTDRE